MGLFIEEVVILDTDDNCERGTYGRGDNKKLPQESSLIVSSCLRLIAPHVMFTVLHSATKVVCLYFKFRYWDCSI